MIDIPDFSQTAMDIELEESFLTADLEEADGKCWDRQGIELTECICNDNGVLVFVSNRFSSE